MRTTVKLESVGALIEGHHENPFELLGPHQIEHRGRPATAVRAFLPQSAQAWVFHPAHQASTPMRRIHPAGLFEAICPWSNDASAAEYQLRVEDGFGNTSTMHDPYSFKSFLSEYDVYLHGEGRHWRAYDRLGAHVRTIDGVTGVNFAVWAPNAGGVSVVGEFNDWDGRRHPMQKHIPAGIWELFVPGLKEGDLYKYRVNRCGEHVEKADPFGFAAERPPRTASVVAELGKHHWNDEPWMKRRSEINQLEQPISIYEIHLGSWKRNSAQTDDWLSYRELAHQLVDYCKEMGYTHLELLPVSEHPFTGSWGYQTVGYFAPTSRYGSPDDFMYFVDHCHQNGIGVLIDWVPAHFPRDDHGLRRFDGSPLYEHSDPRQGEHPDWGTMIFNYDRSEVRTFLLSNALFWLDKYHIDGLRVDAVASMLYLDYSREEGDWVPNRHGGRENLGAISLLQEFNHQAHTQFPGVLTVAEESTAWGGVTRPPDTGGLGFSLKWNMGWMNDTLGYFRHEPIHRKFHHNELTFSLIYAFTENFALPFSHDEVVHGKGSLLDQMPGDLWQKFANLRMLFAYQWTHPGKNLVYMGGDFGQWNEWDHNTSLQWNLLDWDSHKGLKRMVADLNAMYRREPALFEQDFDWQGFEWIDCHSADDSILAFARNGKDPGQQVITVCNFTPVVRPGHRMGVPSLGWYEEIFNTDSELYGGGNVGNHPGRNAEPIPAHGRDFSIDITLPPLSVTVFKRQ